MSTKKCRKLLDRLEMENILLRKEVRRLNSIISHLETTADYYYNKHGE